MSLSPYKLLSAEQMAHVLRLTSPHSFSFNIRRMNAMYKLPINTEPSLDKLHKPNGDPETAVQRIEGFIKTLRDEVAEGTEIYFKLRMLEAADASAVEDILGQASATYLGDAKNFAKLVDFGLLVEADRTEAKEDVLTDITDWLGDIMVYCRSEGMKFGLPLEDGLEAIMGSNFTKLPSDGIPIHDANGKFLKDMTNFVPPENALKTILFGNASADQKMLAKAQETIGKTESGLVLRTDGEPQSIAHLTTGQPGSGNHPYSKIDALDGAGPGTGAESDVL